MHMIKNVNVKINKLNDEVSQTFGHKFTVCFDVENCNYDDLEFHWYEKANAKYYIGRQDSDKTNTIDKWADLYEAAKSYSDVFKDLLDEVDNNRTIECIDSPYIKLERNNNRILEFFIVIKDKSNTFVIKARQVLAVSDKNSITVQDFSYEIQEGEIEIIPSKKESDYYNAIDL